MRALSGRPFRFGSFATWPTLVLVRCYSNSGQRRVRSDCPLCAKRRHSRWTEVGFSDASVLAHLADMVLGVKLKAKLGNEIELGLQEVDMTFLVRHQLLEQVARHIIPC